MENYLYNMQEIMEDQDKKMFLSDNEVAQYNSEIQELSD